jgi:hypothetical protein
MVTVAIHSMEKMVLKVTNFHHAKCKGLGSVSHSHLKLSSILILSKARK